MFSLPVGSGLQDALSLLPEPVLVVGNKLVDGDTAGCVSAILDFLREQGKEAYTAHFAPLSPDIAWIYDLENDLNETIVEDYESLVVVDDFVESERLGFTIKSDVPIINIDHHMTNRPSTIKEGDVLENRIWVEVVGNKYLYWGCMPAAACLLICSEIYHPHLYVSLYQDTVGFTVNGADVVRYLWWLFDGLEQRGEPITNDMQEDMLQRMTPTASLTTLDSFMNADMITWTAEYNKRGVQVCVAIIEDDIPQGAWTILTSLRMFSDVTVVINSKTGKSSIRSRNYDFDTTEISKLFGGGGHIRASGFKVNNSTPATLSADVDTIVQAIASKMTNVQMKYYFS